MSNEVDPIEVLREDLENDSVEVQLEAVRNLQTIALALGPQGARTRLLELLQQYCFPVEKATESYSNIKSLGAKEEVLREIAKMLDGEMIPLFGMDQSFPMLEFLQKLAMVEETVIREAAVDSIVDCASKLDRSNVDIHVLPLITYLSEAEWWTSRVSAASCGPRLYPMLKSQKCREQTADMVAKICKDEMPMVRQEAYINIPRMLKSLAKNNIAGLMSFISPILKSLCKELQENMRHRIVDIVKVLLEINQQANDEGLRSLCKEYLTLVINDGNWRVRKRFLDKLMDISEASTAKFLNDEVLPGFARRLGDAEPSVRVKAIQLLPKFLAQKNCSAKKVNERITMEVVRTLVRDEFPEVREATSGSLLDLFEKKMEAEALKGEILDEVVEFLKLFQGDESGEVRMNFCKGLEKAYNIVGENRFVSSLLDLVIKLQEDTKWRVRCGVIENVTILTRLAKNKRIDEEKMKKMMLNPFKDPVCAVRNRATEQIPALVREMGPEWVITNVFDTIVSEFCNSKSKYLLRIVPIRVGERLALSFKELPEKQKPLLNKSIDQMCTGCKDAISNVRLVSAQSLMAFMDKSPLLDLYKDGIRKALEPLAGDIDDDVKYFGVRALGQLAY